MEVFKCVVFFVMVASTLQFADAQVIGLPSLINISGNVSCSLTGMPVLNATTPTIPFPNASVEVACGGNVISSIITNGSGMFNTTLNSAQALFSGLLLPRCNVRVATPLSNCNENLPSTGVLQSSLQLVSTTVQGLFNVYNFVPVRFELIGN